MWAGQLSSLFWDEMWQWCCAALRSGHGRGPPGWVSTSGAVKTCVNSMLTCHSVSRHLPAQVCYYRDKNSINKFQLAKVTAEGVTISGALEQGGMATNGCKASQPWPA